MLKKAAGGEADPEAGDGLVGEAALVEIGTGLGGEAGVVVVGGGGEDLLDAAALADLEKVVGAHLTDRDFGAVGEEAEGLDEGDVLALFDEAEYVPPCPAAETFEILALRVDVKARRLLVVEGAKGPVGMVERKVLRNNFYDVVCFPDFFDQAPEVFFLWHGGGSFRCSIGQPGRFQSSGPPGAW